VVETAGSASAPARGADGFLRSVLPIQVGAMTAVDLRDVRWVSPTAMVAIAALAHRCQRAGGRFVVHGPVRTDPATYAARMRLGEVLSSLGADHDLPVVSARDQRANLLEVLPVRSDADADRLAALVYGKLRRRDRRLASALHRSIGEVGANVADHAGTIGFVAAQTMPRRNELTLAVADSGVGLLHTLAGRGARDHAQAIEYAVAPAVSRFDDPDRGLGLPRTLEVVRELSGSLYIATGDASVRHGPHRRRFLRSDLAFPGTVVEARIPLSGTTSTGGSVPERAGDATRPE
jgi:hypothetical protein